MDAIFWTYIATYVLLAFLVIGLFYNSKRSKGKMGVTTQTAIGIVTRNGWKGLVGNRDIWMAQSCPVYVIDDHSTDPPPEEMMFPPFIYFRQDHGRSGKWQGLQKLLEVCEAEKILLSDDDCRPASSDWVALMSGFGDDEVVIGYSPQESGEQWVSRLFAYEGLQTTFLYGLAAKWGFPYMAVGRNMLVPRVWMEQAFERLGADLSEGTDDLLLQQVPRSKVVLNEDWDAYVVTRAREDMISWQKQKKRHYRAASSYRWTDLIVPGGFFLLQFLFWSSVIALFFLGHYKLILFLLGVRYLTQFMSMGKLSKSFGSFRDLMSFPILEPWLIVNQLRLYLASKDGGQDW